MLFLLLLFFFPSTHERYAYGKQYENIQSSDDEGHECYLRRFLSIHIPPKMQAALSETEPSTKPRVSVWNVIHSSKGKKTKIRTQSHAKPLLAFPRSICSFLSCFHAPPKTESYRSVAA
jgi:hypothetical protein